MPKRHQHDGESRDCSICRLIYARMLLANALEALGCAAAVLPIVNDVLKEHERPRRKMQITDADRKRRSDGLKAYHAKKRLEAR